jgi:hypothetical protein
MQRWLTHIDEPDETAAGGGGGGGVEGQGDSSVLDAQLAAASAASQAEAG